MFYTRNDSDIKDIKEAYIKGKLKKSKKVSGGKLQQKPWNSFRRLGRRMDVVRSFGGKLTLKPYSRYWKCEINFPPVLDEHFSVNTSKQQIIPDERFIETLEKTIF